jgi:hypothetical protein
MGGIVRNDSSLPESSSKSDKVRSLAILARTEIEVMFTGCA